MKLEDKVDQLTDLMADLIPTVDKLNKTVKDVQKTQQKTNIEFHEMRLSNMKLAEAIEKLTDKIDKSNKIEKRVDRIEKTLFK